MDKIYIGIDPDLKKSGFAIWNGKHSPTLCIVLLSVPSIIMELIKCKEDRIDITVIIESGWLNKKANFRQTQNKAIGEAIARKVGENHAAGKIIEQACQELGITYKLTRPRTSKVTPAYFEKLTGIKTKNQECIDAGMLVYGL